MKKRLFHSLIASTICVSLLISSIPQNAQAAIFSASWSSVSYGRAIRSGKSSSNKGSVIESSFQYEKASKIKDIITICYKYDVRTVTTGVRNQIEWMNQLYSAVVQDFVGQLSLGDTLLLAVLNHSDINKVLMTSSYSIGDLNREVAQKIADGVEGYGDINAIVKATGLTEQDVRSILERIAAGSITEKTITTGKNSSSNTNRGPYLRNQAEKQEKVFQYLSAEVERMAGDPDSLAVLYNDLGTGYVDNMLSGDEIDRYLVSLYKKNLAETLDSIVDSKNPYSVSTYDISKTDAYKISKKTRSALSKVFQYEIGAAKDSLSDEAAAFLDEHLKNGTLSESEAREYLILCGEYEKGEHGIGEAAKQIVKGYKHLKGLKDALDKTGEIIDVVEKIKKAESYIDYWATDYAEQELLLDALVENLSNSGADMELMAAAKELKQDYDNKLSGTFDKVYSALIDKGIGTVKSAFPPLGIAEACISLAGTITGASDKASALETGFAMQGICKQAVDNYEKAVIAVKNGNTSEEAVSKVLNTFETARQSLVSYYKAMITLAETKEQKDAYSAELKKLEKAEFGYVTVSIPLGGGGGGSR